MKRLDLVSKSWAGAAMARVGGVVCRLRGGGIQIGYRAAVGTILTVTLAACGPREEVRAFAGVQVPKAYEKPDLWLTDTEGRRFNFRDETAGTLTLVEFGYTHCPDICPVTMANIAAALARQSYDVSSKVKVYFVTQDPERDTPAVLRKWLDAFDHRFVGIVGPPGTVDSLAKAFDVPPAAFARSSATDTAYSVGHASQVVVFTADNLAHLVYPFGVRQEAWTRDLPKLVAMTEWTGERQ